MILTKTPLRISFAGGGSDYINSRLAVNKVSTPGQVISVTIDKFVYVIINKKHDNLIRISYSKTENVSKIEKIKHDIIRNCLKFCKIKNGIEIITMADIPSSGSGLGSSSALTVGLLKALNKYNKKKISKMQLAKDAYYVEAIMGKKMIGLQDHFSASFGGFKNYIFKSFNNITVVNLKISKENIKKFKDNLSMHYTGINRKADKILSSISKTYSLEKKRKLTNDSIKFKKLLINNDFKQIGKIFNDAWLYKKNFGSKKIRKLLNDHHSMAIKKGMYGGKILGAGGGGYFLFLANKTAKKRIFKKLNNLELINFNFYNKGAEIVYDD
jgi:D-glycero-alpha-D-manno-heptose-7-phosphate kinase|tara:strand:+ start:404 stop:1384 length:981 start_codon:yes stop_codon:yes gene_type:complete